YLHHAIQSAIGWDDDHLYAFYMNGKRYDHDYEIADPRLEEDVLYAAEVAVGELGLVVGHKFMYFFDFGDSHEFEVEVVGIRPRAEPASYPRVIDSAGEAPAQYGYGPDDWDEEEEAEA